jgi:hypothetical protein
MVSTDDQGVFKAHTGEKVYTEDKTFQSFTQPLFSLI